MPHPDKTEAPLSDFERAVGRTHRQGQDQPMPTAKCAVVGCSNAAHPDMDFCTGGCAAVQMMRKRGVAEKIRDILEANFAGDYNGDQARHDAMIEAGFCMACGIDVRGDDGTRRTCHCENDE